MGILQRRHLSLRGEVIATSLQAHVEAEAEGLEMVANRLQVGLPTSKEDPEFRELVSYLADAAKRLRHLVEDL